MTCEGTRSKRGGRRAVVAALASIFLASCATSGDDNTFMGFSPTQQMAAGSGTDFAGQTINTASSAPVVANQFVMDEDDPSLPDAVVEAPTLRPVSAEEAAAIAQAQAAAGQETMAAEETAQPMQGEQPRAPIEVAAAAPQPEQPQPAQPQPAAAAQADPARQPTQFAENPSPAASEALALAAEPKKRGFLANLFGAQPARAAPAPQQAARPLIVSSSTQTASTTPAAPIVQLASTSPATAASPIIPRGGEAALPGVRQNALFEISRRSGVDDDSDIDLHEDSSLYQVASAAGLARLAPNGLMKQTEHVDVACLKPSLVRVLKTVENHYGRKVVVTSGYRNSERNRRARGARNSLHMYCAAADVQVEGVSKWELAEFVRNMPGRGGVGTYCHTESVHIDVGPERDWNWRCRRRK